MENECPPPPLPTKLGQPLSEQQRGFLAGSGFQLKAEQGK